MLEFEQFTQWIFRLENNFELLKVIQLLVEWKIHQPDFSRECQNYSHLLEAFNVFQNDEDYVWAMKSNILVRMGAFLNKIKKGLNK